MHALPIDLLLAAPAGSAGATMAAARQRGISSTAVHDAIAARAAIATGTYDVLLVDFALGVETGLDLLRAFHADPDIAVVMTAENPTAALAMTGDAWPAFEFVHGPASPTLLIAAVERAAAHRRIVLNHRRLLWEMQTLNEVSEGIAHSLHLASVLDSALRNTCRTLGTTNASIRLKDPDTGSFPVAATFGPATHRRLWTDQGGPVPRPSDEVIATGNPVVIGDLWRVAGQGAHDRTSGRSAISVPMLVGDELVGTLSVLAAQPDRFTAADQRLVTLIAAQIGVAVQNARLHGVVRRGKEQWEQTFDAIEDPIGVFDPGGVLLRGNAALAKHLGIDVRGLKGLRCRNVGFCGSTCPDCTVQRTDARRSTAQVTTSDGEIFDVRTFPMGGLLPPHTAGVRGDARARWCTRPSRSVDDGGAGSYPAGARARARQQKGSRPDARLEPPRPVPPARTAGSGDDDHEAAAPSVADGRRPAVRLRLLSSSRERDPFQQRVSSWLLVTAPAAPAERPSA